MGGCQVKNKTFTSLSLECSAGYDGGLKQYFVAILCPYTTFTEVLDSQAESSSNLVNLEKLNCEREIASQRNFNGPAFTFDHLPHGSPFSLAIFAQNIKVRKEQDGWDRKWKPFFKKIISSWPFDCTTLSIGGDFRGKIVARYMAAPKRCVENRTFPFVCSNGEKSAEIAKKTLSAFERTNASH